LPQAARLAPLAAAMRRASSLALERRRSRADALAVNLAHLNPHAVLERGYAIVTARDGTIVQDSAGVAIGEEVAIAFARGSAGAKITRRD
jgi:exodeoxyribonuclease VII large subunit